MISYHRFILDNGLKVLFHYDNSCTMAVVNTLYDVGARDENPNKTGFAHLFEHLMFGGSKNIQDFDNVLQNAGGESNAFTSNDITNYYDLIPTPNIETALWLESDRMLSLSFLEKSLNVQKNVVIEEFKQRYLNQPYGDVWLKLRPLCYKTHPYQWATIGKEIAHIEQATLQDVKDFFFQHYAPNTAILTIAGNIQKEYVEDVVNKWYRDIPSVEKKIRNIEKEVVQSDFRQLTIERKVPQDAFYYAFKMQKRNEKGYILTDLLSDYLAGDKSSVLYQTFVKEKKYCTEIQSYILGSLDEGLLLISGKISPGISLEEINTYIWEKIEQLKIKSIDEKELSKLKNKFLTSKEFQDQSTLNRAMNLSFFELLGNVDTINKEFDEYLKIDINSFHLNLNHILKQSSCSLLQVKAIS